ncbi:Holliday junction resolvase RecU [Orenia marismortui]|uniref:Holliday junction resolvase RecU n=1 Tax=Orenia marismortui TaxID=46469 RepID=A0A4R8GR36_9FIRM|nr:Holliday junction resolvase RecU [Orenia marismortui]TDX48296.1 recombination protein U [Orenia marismortui]
MKRGDLTEGIINRVNLNYKHRGIAEINKVPTPTKYVGKCQQKWRRNKGHFIACFDSKSTVDYIGTFQGKSIAFDAKESQVDTRFDLKNIKKHQYKFLKRHVTSGGIGFLLIHFTNLHEFYYLPFKILDKYWTDMIKNDGRKSIPYNAIARPEYRISQGKEDRRGIYIDYLNVIEKEILAA